MTLYPSPANVNWSAGLNQAPIYANSVTNGWFSALLFLAIFVIFGTAYFANRRDFFGALAVGSTIAWLVALLFFAFGATTGLIFGICTAVMILSFASLFIPREE